MYFVMENIEYIIKLSHKRATMPTMMHDVQLSLAVRTYFGVDLRAAELRVYATSLIMILLGFSTAYTIAFLLLSG